MANFEKPYFERFIGLSKNISYLSQINTYTINVITLTSFKILLKQDLKIIFTVFVCLARFAVMKSGGNGAGLLDSLNCVSMRCVRPN